jgi:hypothetical protein
LNRSALFPFISIVLIYLLSTSGVGLIFLPFFPFIFLKFYERADKNRRVVFAFMAVFFAAGAVLSLNAAIFLSLAVIPSAVLIILHSGGERKSWRTVIYPALPALLFTALAVSVPHIRQVLTDEIVKAIELFYMSLNIQDAERLSDSMLNSFYLNRAKSAQQAVLLAPAAIFSTVSMIIYFTELLRFRKLPHRIIRLPDPLLILIVLGGALAAIPANRFLGGGVNYIGFNFLLAAAVLYFYRGFDLILYFMERWKLSPFFRVFFCVLVLLESLLMVLVSVLGVISVFKNFIKDDNADKV